MPYEVTSSEWAEIDGVPLETPAWSCRNLFVLWAGPATRGQDRVIPGSPGVLANRRRATVRTVTLELTVFGDRDWEGVVYPDAREGLRANWEHLRVNVADPLPDGGTRTLVLHLPDGSTVSGTVHVENMEPGGGLGPYAMPATLDLSIKEGALS